MTPPKAKRPAKAPKPCPRCKPFPRGSATANACPDCHGKRNFTEPKVTLSPLEKEAAALRARVAALTEENERLHGSIRFGRHKELQERAEAAEARVTELERLVRTARVFRNDEQRIRDLEGALRFYADPSTYFAIAFLGDRPCGEFMEDCSPAADEYGFEKNVPGKRARAALAPATPPAATEPPPTPDGLKFSRLSERMIDAIAAPPPEPRCVCGHEKTEHVCDPVTHNSRCWNIDAGKDCSCNSFHPAPTPAPTEGAPEEAAWGPAVRRFKTGQQVKAFVSDAPAAPTEPGEAATEGRLDCCGGRNGNHYPSCDADGRDGDGHSRPTEPATPAPTEGEVARCGVSWCMRSAFHKGDCSREPCTCDFPVRVRAEDKCPAHPVPAPTEPGAQPATEGVSAYYQGKRAGIDQGRAAERAACIEKIELALHARVERWELENLYAAIASRGGGAHE